MEYVAYYLLMAAGWWRSLGDAGPYYVWLISGVVGLLVWFYVAHLVLRRLLGHTKWRDSWYTEAQMQELINILAEDQSSGHRVMRHDEIELLRRWRTGDSSGLGLDRRNLY
jgi:hypothetical protein